MPTPKNNTPNDQGIPRSKTLDSTAINTPDTEIQTPQEEAPQVVPGALNNAIMRTFRSDTEHNGTPVSTDALKKRIEPEPVAPKTQQEDIASSATTSSEEAGEARPKSVVRTFKDDVQNLVRDREMSLAHIAALESNRGGKDTPVETTTRHNSFFIILLAGGFILLATLLGGGAYYAYSLNAGKTTNKTAIVPSFIFTEARNSIDIANKSPRAITGLLASARKNVFFSLGSVVEFYPVRTHQNEDGQNVTNHVGTQAFLEALSIRAPDTFIQTIGSEYVIGIHVVDESIPFLILTTDSYGHAFSGMLEWESFIEEDMMPFFSPNAEVTRPAIAESENMFVDTVIENIDTRILRDTTGQTRLVYAFVDRSTLVITTNIRTLVELADRIRIK